jgi:hypothetical protein
MKDKKDLPEMLELFKEEFDGELSMLNTLVNFELLILEIGQAIDETPNDTILGGKIRVIMNNWMNKNKDIQKSSNNDKKKSKHPKIELLNSEGPILILKRTSNAFLMYDEWKFLVGKFTVESLDKFLAGKSTITDSNNRVWNYKEQSEGMKQNPEKLEEFISVLR